MLVILQSVAVIYIYHNSAPQYGAMDLNSDDMNPNFQTRNSLKVQVLDSSFANNSASVGGGGAICASAISISIYQAFFFFFFQGDLNTKQKKKLSRNHHIIELGA